MSPLIALLVLAVVQGLTEYLPVSSSGHLVLVRLLTGEDDVLPTGAVIEVWLHLGTLLAVLLFYRERIFKLAQGVLGGGVDVANQRRLFLLLIVGTIPAGLVGVLFEKQLEVLFNNPTLVGVALLLTGMVLWASRSIPDRKGDLLRLTVKAALLIGVVQAFAIAPGISRSGMTIVAGMVLGLSVESAAAFSFLLSIPAILGAAVLKVPHIFAGEGEPEVPLMHLFLSFVTAFGVGLAALGMLLWLARGQKLSWFAPYCWAAGVVAISMG
ncbi:MAG: undecaprenyl-diphosphate phosphatase [Planctomycetes bacterium]|nr:undecaprenyl-diphosphate phosphatase [Planctomycetota bacterium]